MPLKTRPFEKVIQIVKIVFLGFFSAMHTKMLSNRNMLAFMYFAITHVPTYSGCTKNCCQPPHRHTTSQVIYLKGSGGLEIHLKSNTNPINTLENEILDVDAVFRDQVDQSTYDLYIGCGGCVEGVDPIVISPTTLKGYEAGELEPFTQTRYFSVFSKNERKFNSTLLRDTVCPEKHFTIRLVDYMNRTDDEPIFWAPVIGLSESFTFRELFEFPIYILRNHGSYWNELGYTYWVSLVSTTIILLFVKYFFKSSVFSFLHHREVFYEIAIIGFTSAAIEETVHLVYSQYGIPIEYGFYLGFFLVILFAQGIPLVFVYVVKMSLYNQTSCTANAWWAPLEVATGFSFFFFLGSGFFIGPVSVMIAGLIRCREITVSKKSQTIQLDATTKREQRPKRNTMDKGTMDKGLGFIPA